MIADSFRTRRDILFCLPLNDGILPNQGSQPQHRTQQQHIITGSHFDEEMRVTGCHISHTEGDTPAPGPASRCPGGCVQCQGLPPAAGQPAQALLVSLTDPWPALWHPEAQTEDRVATPLEFMRRCCLKSSVPAAHGTYPSEEMSPGAAWAESTGTRAGQGVLAIKEQR